MARNALAATAAALAVGVTPGAVATGLADFRAVKGRLQALRASSGALVLDDTYNANPDSMRAAIDVLAAAGGTRWLVLGDMGEVGAAGPAFHREIGAYAREQGVTRLYATGDLAREAVAAFGAGATHVDDVPSLASQAATRRACRRHGAGQGLALHADGARGGRAHRASTRKKVTDAAAPVRMARAIRPRVQRVRVHHAARGAGDDDGARHLVPHRPADDRMAVADEDRPVGARRRPAVASGEGRHADDGRRVDPGIDRRHHAAVGRSRQPLRVGRPARHARLRRRGLDRRLAEGRLPQSEGPLGAPRSSYGNR